MHNSGDDRTLIDQLKNELLKCISDGQREYFSAGKRYSKMQSNQDAKFLDAVARVFCFHTNSTCSAVYINKTKKQVLLSSNRNNLMPSDIKNAWHDIMSKNIKFTQYVEKFKTQHTTFTINGYMGPKDCDTLLENLRILRFKKGAIFNDFDQHSKLKKLLKPCDQLEQKVRDFITSAKESRNQDNCSNAKIFYTNAITQAHTCANIFKALKKEYLLETKSKVKVPPDRKVYKSLYNYLAEDQTIVLSITSLKHVQKLKSLIYSFRKLDFDLQKINDSITSFSNYDVVAPHHGKVLHAEIKIIDYLQSQDSFDACITNHRIGISKLACAMCNEVIKAFNKQAYNNNSDIKITMKGYHGKVYKQWHYSPEGNLEIYKAALTNIAVQYQIGFLLQDKMQKDQASSNTSMTTYFDDTEIEEFNPEFQQDQMQELQNTHMPVITKYAYILKNLLILHMNDQFGYDKTGIKVFDASLYCRIGDVSCFPDIITKYAQDDELTRLLGEYNRDFNNRVVEEEEESWA